MGSPETRQPDRKGYSYGYKVTLRDFAIKDFAALDKDIQRQAIRQFEKLRHNPELGKDLGHRMGVDLTGYRALHFYKNQYRIIYKILEDQREVEVWGIGKRESGKVYKMVSERVQSEEQS